MDMIKKQTPYGWITLAAAIMALVGMIIYIATSTTGYLAGTAVDAWPIVLAVIVILVAVALVLFSDKIDSRITGAIIVVLAALVAIGFARFVLARVTLIADVYFIPVNFPASEAETLYASIVGFVFYVLTFIALAIAAFGSGLTKSKA